MTFRKSQVSKLNEDGILPKELSDRLIAPEGVDLREPLLKPYVREVISMPAVDIAAIDLQRFYLELMQDSNPWCIFNHCSGLYVSKKHLYASGELADDTIKKLKKDYKIDLPEVILIGEKPEYFALVHEYLHSIFNHLPEEKRNHLLNSMKSNAQFSRALSLTHMNISYFDWPRKIEKEGGKLMSQFKPTDHIYTLDKLEKKDQLMCIDEIIAYFYTTKRPTNRKALPSELTTAMNRVGYKTRNPPEEGRWTGK